MDHSTLDALSSTPRAAADCRGMLAGFERDFVTVKPAKPRTELLGFGGALRANDRIWR